jgi:alpha-tubulin suppressor-like RCC1 family protein
VKCWGSNFNGQLGDGTIFARNVPTAVIGLPGQAMYLDLGWNHSCAVVQNGSSREVWCWGAGLHGQLGNGLPFDSWTAVRAGSIADAWMVAAGEAHTCATTQSGPVYCWGHNLAGQLGNDSVFDSWTPVAVVDASATPLSAAFATIAAGGGHSCAAPVGPLQLAACWGRNGFGQLGNNSIFPSARAQVVSGIAAVTSVTAGENHSCARPSGTGLVCWGENSEGQLGDGTSLNRLAPVQVAGACY